MNDMYAEEVELIQSRGVKVELIDRPSLATMPPRKLGPQDLAAKILTVLDGVDGATCYTALNLANTLVAYEMQKGARQ